MPSGSRYPAARGPPWPGAPLWDSVPPLPAGMMPSAPPPHAGGRWGSERSVPTAPPRGRGGVESPAIPPDILTGGGGGAGDVRAREREAVVVNCSAQVRALLGTPALAGRVPGPLHSPVVGLPPSVRAEVGVHGPPPGLGHGRMALQCTVRWIGSFYARGGGRPSPAAGTLLVCGAFYEITSGIVDFFSLDCNGLVTDF